MGIYLGSTPVSLYAGGKIVETVSGTYVWSKHESENSPILDYVVGEKYYDYPSNGYYNGFYYKKVINGLPYLSFVANEDFTLKTYNTTKNWDGTLEYSTDTSTWTTWDGTEISSAGSKLYLRGTGNTKIAGNDENYRFVFTGTSALKIACEGNIENLLDYTIVSSGNHPCMGTYCYDGMFYGCTSLTTAPALPATTLANYCYNSMFQGCTKIKLSTTQTGEYQTPYRIPTSGTGATATNALQNMFAYTGGTFKGTPSINTTYYTSNTVV